MRFIRRPAFPGEFNHEFIWPLFFVGGVVFAAGFFALGGETPDCLFHHFTGLPCLGCGGTRCARSLVQGHFWQAFKMHPGFFLFCLLACLWTIYSILFWLGRDTRRLRFYIVERYRRRCLILGLLSVALHWAWQCYYLTR